MSTEYDGIEQLRWARIHALAHGNHVALADFAAVVDIRDAGDYVGRHRDDDGHELTTQVLVGLGHFRSRTS